MTPSSLLLVLRVPIAANVPAGQKPISKLFKELWKNRGKPETYNRLMERLHTRRDEFLNSLCRFKFDPKVLLQILVDYHQKHKVANLPDKAACLIRGGKICFSSLQFQFPLQTHPDFRADYSKMISQSMRNCRSKEEGIRATNDLAELLFNKDL